MSNAETGIEPREYQLILQVLRRDAAILHNIRNKLSKHVAQECRSNLVEPKLGDSGLWLVSWYKATGISPQYVLELELSESRISPMDVFEFRDPNFYRQEEIDENENHT